MNRIGSDVQEVEWSVVCSLQMFFRDPILVIVFLITLFSISYKFICRNQKFGCLEKKQYLCSEFQSYKSMILWYKNCGVKRVRQTN